MKTIICAFAFMCLSVNALAGVASGGGGDECEARFQLVRDDFITWINSWDKLKRPTGLGPGGLKSLPGRMTSEQYADTMLAQLNAPTKIKCVGKGDRDYPVEFNGHPKTCRFEKQDSKAQIICDFEKFNKTAEDDQYKLVHHEYAGLAGIEIPVGDDSIYTVSNQISGYLEWKKVKTLAIKAPSGSSNAVSPVINVCDRTADIRNQIETSAGVACDHMTAELLTKVKNIGLMGKIASLKVGDFDGLTSLESLDLMDDNLGVLPKGIFDGLSSLRYLNVGGNDLKDLDWDTFKDLKSLFQLVLSRNKLTTLPNNIFNSNRALSELFLDENKITNLPREIFNGLTSLTFLDLNKNQISYIDPRQFQGLTHLNFLFLGGNPIASITRSHFQDLGSLKTLDIILQVQGTLDSDLFYDLTALQELYLRSDTLVELPAGLLKGLQKLETFSLDGSKLSSLDANFFGGLTGLKSIGISGNQFKTLPDKLFSGLTSLKSLLVGWAQITDLPIGIFSDLSSLENLNLRKNKLTWISPKVFRESGFWKSIKSIYLTENPLSPINACELNRLFPKRVEVFIDVPDWCS